LEARSRERLQVVLTTVLTPHTGVEPDLASVWPLVEPTVVPVRRLEVLERNKRCVVMRFPPLVQRADVQGAARQVPPGEESLCTGDGLLEVGHVAVPAHAAPHARLQARGVPRQARRAARVAVTDRRSVRNARAR
jgi:hypothetical protein